MGSQKSFEVLEEEKKSSLLGAKIISNRNFVYSFCFGTFGTFKLFTYTCDEQNSRKGTCV